MSRKLNSLSLVLTAMCTFAAVGVVGRSRSLPNASDFYIVSVGFSDALPGWHRSVLEVRPEGADVLVRYVRSGPASRYCGTVTKIVSASARVPGTSLLTIARGLNLCAIDPTAVARTTRAFAPAHAAVVYAGDRFVIVAKCGAETRVIRLPGDWELDMARLKRKSPRIAGLWTLEQTVGAQAFGLFPSIDVVPSEMEVKLQPADEATLAELKSGKFDTGLAPLSFKNDVAALQSASDVPVYGVKLANADRFRFARYVDPQYPPIALQARISGRVELELVSNPATGQVEQVTVVSGHPLLAAAAKESAQHWRFVPGTDSASHAARVVLEFIFNCP